MSSLTTYLLNVALHAAILSVFATVALACLRQARHRSVAAIAGLLAVGFLPWLSALRPAQPLAAPAPDIPTQEAPALPTWTVMTLPAQKNAIPTTTAPTSAPAKFVFPDPLGAVTTIWAAGAGIGALLLSIASLKVSYWQKTLQPLDDSAWRTLRSLSPEIPARHRFLLSGTTSSPCVTGFFRPRIVLPRFLFASGSEAGLRWAVRHEIAHWQAGDSRWIILFALIRCTNWWNPLVHRLVTKWSDAREQLCDLQATGLSETRADYGEFLISIARRITAHPPLTVTMAQRRHADHLKQRVVSLLAAKAGSEKPVGKRFFGISAIGFITMAVLVSGARINAEEPVKENETHTATLQDQDQRGRLLIGTTMIFSRKPLDPKNGEVLRSGELVKLIEKAKKEGWVIDNQTESQANGESRSWEFSRITTSGLGSGTTSEWRRPKPNDPPGSGISFDTMVSQEADLVYLRIHSQYRFLPGSAYPVSLSAPKTYEEGSKLQFKQAAAKARLKFGEALSTNFGEVDPGVFLQVFTTAVPMISGRYVSFTTPAPRWPSAEVKGRWRISGVKITARTDEVKAALEKFPAESMFRRDDEAITLTGSRAIEVWQSVLGSKIQTLPPVEFSMNESHVPWPTIPGFEISVIVSDDYENLGIIGKPPQDAVYQGTHKIPYIPSGWQLAFKPLNDDPRMASRVFFKIDVLK